jgi:hypothetical protein
VRRAKSQEGLSARTLSRKHTKDIVKELVKLMKAAKSEPARIAAAKLLLEYGWGKPPSMPEDVADGSEGPIDEIVIRHV